MLERGRLGDLSQPGLQAVRIMSTKVVEMNGLIEQMLDAARLEEGRLQLRLRPVDVRTVVEQAVETVRPLADESHPLLLSLDRQPLVVPVDAERVQTILTNLVDNAIKYSPAGGPVECRVTGTDDSVLVAVHDHGVGIAADDLPRLFSRFGRVSSEATRHIPGIGLGLYLARELARLHGGDIDVESKPGAGSTFVLSLPRGRTAGRPGAPELAAQGGQRGGTPPPGPRPGATPAAEPGRGARPGWRAAVRSRWWPPSSAPAWRRCSPSTCWVPPAARWRSS